MQSSIIISLQVWQDGGAIESPEHSGPWLAGHINQQIADESETDGSDAEEEEDSVSDSDLGLEQGMMKHFYVLIWSQVAFFSNYFKTALQKKMQ